MASNILVAARATPEEVAKSVITNILIVIAPPHTLGAVAPAPVQARINTLALAQATRVAPVRLVTTNINLAPVPLATNGRTALVKH